MEQQWIATRPGDLDVLEMREVDVPAPGPGEVTIRVRAAGLNPADFKHVAGGDAADFPRPVGYEVSGEIVAVGPGTEIASGGGAVGDAVLAFRVRGGFATALTVPAEGRLRQARLAGLGAGGQPAARRHHRGRDAARHRRLAG